MRSLTFALVALTLALPLAAAKGNPHGMPEGNPHGMPDESLWGQCQFWTNPGKGKDNGNAANAPPHRQTQDRAEEEGFDTVQEFCATVERPAEEVEEETGTD